MCTSGALSVRARDGSLRSYLLKTSDAGLTQYWHGVVSHPRGRRAIGYGLVGQGGLNTGLNDAGLAILMAFLDYRVPAAADGVGLDDPFAAWNDRRGIVNAALLARCATVDEGVAFLYEAVRREPDLVGSTYMMADGSGALAVVEQCDRRMAHEVHHDGGVVARGNNGLLVWGEAQAAMPEPVRQDRHHRCASMSEALARLSAEEVSPERTEQGLRAILATHAAEGSEAVGTICAHGVRAPGARAWSATPMWTLSGLILDVPRRRLIYSLGPPCEGRWRTLELEHAA